MIGTNGVIGDVSDDGVVEVSASKRTAVAVVDLTQGGVGSDVPRFLECSDSCSRFGVMCGGPLTSKLQLVWNTTLGVYKCQ